MVLPGRDIRWKEFLTVLKDEWERDNVSDTAGALTFFSVLALFPFLIFLVALASVLIDPAQAQVLIDELSQVAPRDVTSIVGDRLRALGEGQNQGLLTFAAAGAIFSASSGVMALMRALNTVYGVQEGRPFWKTRLIAIGVTLGAAAISILATVAMVATPAVAAALPGPLGTVVLWLRLPFAGALMIAVWACLYYFLPDVEQRFKLITPGSVVGVLVWLVASWGFSVYVANFGSYDATYGALGGVVVLLFWMWITSQVLLLGAEINAVLEHRSPEGKRVGAKSMADAGPDTHKGDKLGQDDVRRMPAPSAVGPAVPADRRERIAALPKRPPRKKLSSLPAIAASAAALLVGSRILRR